MGSRERVTVQDDLSVTLSKGDQILIPNQVEQGTPQTFERKARTECPDCRSTRFTDRIPFEFGPLGEKVPVEALIVYTCIGCGGVYQREKLVQR